MKVTTQMKSIGGSIFSRFAVVLDRFNSQVQQHLNAQDPVQPVLELPPARLNGQQVHGHAATREEETSSLPDPCEHLLKQLNDLRFALNETAIVAFTDAQGRITEVNDRFCAISQYNREELIGQTHHIINSGYHPPAFFQDLWQTISRGQVWRGEIKNRAKDGSEYWVDTVIVPFLGDRGVPVQYMALRFDITRHKLMELALRQSQSRLAEAQRIANLGTWEFDLRTQKLSWSEELFRMCGVNPAQGEPTYDQFQQLVHPEDWPALAAAIEQAITKALSYEVEYRVIHPDGSIRYLLSRGETILDSQGQAIKLIGTGQDQTVAKLAEIALLNSEQQNFAILSTIPDIMTVLSADGYYLSISYNQFKGELIPLQDMNPTGQHISEVFPPDITARCTEAIREALRTGKMQTYEQHLQFGDRIQYEEARIVPYTDDAVLCMVRNISDRKRAELALQDSEAKFRRLAENGPGMIHRYVIHPDGSDEFTYVSPHCEAIYEIDRETALQHPTALWSLVHPEDVAQLQAGIAESLQNWQNFYSEHRIITAKSHTLKWLQVLSSPERMDNGDIFWEGVVIDITARRQAEIALQESEVRLRRLAENLPGVVYRYVKYADGSEAFPYISSRIAEIYGIEAEAVMQDARLMWAAIHPEDVHKIEAKFGIALQSPEKIFNVEHRVVTPTGQTRWTQAISRFEQLAHGDIVWDGVIIDITPRKELEADRERAETQLAEQNALLARVARGESLTDILNALIDLVEQQLNGALCSFLLLDEEDRLRHGAAPTLPEGYIQAVDGVKIGDGIGSCGTAAYRKETIIVTDIDTDPLWQNFHEITQQYGLKACWSSPVVSSEGRVLGTFGVYYREVKAPTESDLNTIKQIANIAGIAIERDRAETALRQSEAKNRAMLAAIPDLLLRVKLDGTCVDYIPPCTTSDAQFVPIQDHLAEVLPADLLQHQIERMQQALTTGELQVWEQKVPKFGKFYDEEIRLTHCEADEFLLVVRDITGRKQAEAALKESEIRFRQLSETVKEGFFVAELHPLKYLYVNPAYADLIGISEEAIYQDSTHWIRNIHPEDYDRIKSALDRELQGETFDQEYRLIQPDSTILWLRSQAYPVVDEMGRVVRIVGTMENISDRKRTEAALRESEARFRQIAETVQEGFFVGELSPPRYSYVNPAYETITGFSAEEIYANSSHWTDSIHPDDRDRILEALQRELQGEIFDQEYRLIRRDGTVQWVRSQGFPLRDETGVITRIVGTQENIDSRKRTEIALKRAEERYTLATRAAKVGVWEWNLRTNDFYLDPNIKGLLGYTDTEIPNNLEQWTAYVHPDDREAVMVAAQAHLDGKTPEYVFEHRMLHKDGSHIWILVRGQLLRDEQGNPERLVGTDTDITDLKQAELALQQLNEDLEQRVQQRTKELFQSERDLRTIFNNVYDAIFIHDLDGTILDVNDRAVEMYGTTRGQLLSCTVADLAPPGTPIERIPLIFQQAWTEGAAQTEWRGQRLNTGEVFDLEVTLRLAQLGTRPVCIACVRDISDRKRAETALRESEERFRQLAENVDEVFWLTALESQILYVSPAFERIWGCPPEQVFASREVFSNAIHPDDRERSIRDMVHRFEVNTETEYRIMRPDGEIRWIRDRAFPIRNQQGEVYRIAGLAEDITERVLTKQALEQSEQRFRNLFEATPNPIQGYDQDRRVIFWNSASEALYGYSRDEAMGQRVEELIIPQAMHSAVLPMVDDWIASQGDPLPDGELELIRKDGSPVTVYSSHVMLTNGHGGREMYCIDVDLRDRKRLEQELRQMNADLESRVEERTLDLQQAMEAAEAANQAKSTFLANMSHELRTPLNAILGFAQLMSRDLTLEPDKRDQLAIINRSGNHLLNLINDILEMSKIEAGRIQFVPTTFDLYILLDSLEEMFQFRAIEKELHFSIDRAHNLPRHIETDEKKLRQVLINLVGNAIKFTRQGTVILRVSRSESMSLTCNRPTSSPHASATLHFEVEDTGPGIDTTELDSLFEPFIQSSNRQLIQEGTGLGLPISRQFVQLMAGELTVRSVLGRGSTFVVAIPVNLPSLSELPTATRPRQILGLTPNQPNYRILVVEDNDTNRQLLVQLLQSVGYEVQTAVNGQDAIALWQSWQPQLIWMDMRMPVMDGYEATRQIRELEQVSRRDHEIMSQADNPHPSTHPATPSPTHPLTPSPLYPPTPILALTASAFEEDRSRVFGAGCNDFVRKPFQEQELLEKMAAHLGVQYLYLDEAEAANPAHPPFDSQAAIAALRLIPTRWLTQLYQATIELNSEELTSLVAKITPQQPLLATLLTEKLNNFDFEQLLQLVQQAMEP